MLSPPPSTGDWSSDGLMKALERMVRSWPDVAETRTIRVPTETGSVCVVEFTHKRPHFWSIDISDELIAMSPEAVHAALGQAVMEMRETT